MVRRPVRPPAQAFSREKAHAALIARPVPLDINRKLREVRPEGLEPPHPAPEAGALSN